MGLATALAMPLLLQFHASGVPGVRAFMLANALTVLSLLLYAAGSFLPLNATVMVSNAAWISALALVYVGVRQFFGLHPHVWRSAALAILCVVAITAMLYGQDRVAARIVLFSVITCAGMVATACVIVDGRRQIRTRGVALYLMLSILDWRRCTCCACWSTAWAGKRPARCCIPRLGHCSSLSAAR